MILGSDDFNRGPSATLGGGWTEQGGGPVLSGASDFDITAAGEATLGAQPGVYAATMDGTSTITVGVQAWIERNALAMTTGLIWRFANNSNFYYAIIYDAAGADALLVVRVKAGASVVLINRIFTGGGNPFGTTLSRLSIIHDANERITAYVDGDYWTGFTGVANTREGELATVVDGSPMALPGPSGLFSSVNNAGSVGGMLWDQFITTDLSPETVYVDYNAATPSFGTAASPDISFSYAFNNVLCQRGSVVQLADGQPVIGNGNLPGAFSLGDYAIGQQKFSVQGGESFPTYSPEDGTELTAGSPILTIQGSPSTRTILREVRNTSFFLVRGMASYILVRGIDFESTTGITSRLIGTDAANNLGVAVEHSARVDKCDLLGTIAGGDELILFGHSADEWGAQYCNFAVTNAFDRMVTVGDAAADQMGDGGLEFCTVEGEMGAFVRLIGTVPAAALHTYAHLTSVDIESGAVVTSVLQIDDAANVVGDVRFRDNITVSRGINPTDFGVRIIANLPAGTITRDHNGYFGVVAEASVGVTDNGDEITGDPEFLDEANPYLWPQTAGSPAMTIPSDWRPGAPAYKFSASDSYLGVVLDRGALLVIVVPVPPGPDLSRHSDFCVRVIYDPNGLNLDLSDRLLDTRPIVQEQDILLRRYKLSDTHVEVVDREGLFVEGSSSSVITDSNGLPTWVGKEVLIQYYSSPGDDAELILEYLGFMIGVTSSRGRSQLRLGNRLQQLFRRKPLANDAGQIISTDNTRGTTIFVPASGSYLSNITPSVVDGCGVEVWTFSFLNANQFEVTGSRTGLDGEGDVGADFTSDSGRITALSADWVGAFAANSECSIKTVYRYSSLTAVDAFEETLINANLGALDASDVSNSVQVLKGSAVDQALSNGLVVDEDVTVVDLIESVAFHLLGNGIEMSNGNVGLSAYAPKLSEEVVDVLCKHLDLMAATIDRTPIYNVFTFEFGYDEATETFTERLTFPVSDDENTSLILYGRKIESPQSIKLKGYSAGNAGWVRSMAQQQFVRWGEPRPIFKPALKESRLGMELDEFFRVDSEAPTTTTLIVQPSKISRRITSNPGVDAELIDVSFYLQFEGACGFMFHDVNHLHDDCWIHF